MAEAKKEPKTVKVRIYTPHTHAGKKYKPGPEGIEIEVPEHDAAFLKSIGALDKPEQPAADAAKH